MADRLLVVGALGSAATALCCLTPALPAILGALGAGGLVGLLYRDAVLLPLLGVFLTLTAYALWRRRRS